MTDVQQTTVDVLNELHAAETASILARLEDLCMFASADQLAICEPLSADAREHRRWLVEAIEACGGAVLPVPMDVATASLHYASMGAILPRAAASLEHLVRLYTKAGKKPLTPSAVELIARITRRYASHLEKLRAIAA